MRPGGFEPPTRGLEGRCSSAELRARPRSVATGVRSARTPKSVVITVTAPPPKSRPRSRRGPRRCRSRASSARGCSARWPGLAIQSSTAFFGVDRRRRPEQVLADRPAPGASGARRSAGSAPRTTARRPTRARSSRRPASRRCAAARQPQSSAEPERPEAVRDADAVQLREQTLPRAPRRRCATLAEWTVPGAIAATSSAARQARRAVRRPIRLSLRPFGPGCVPSERGILRGHRSCASRAILAALALRR